MPSKCYGLLVSDVEIGVVSIIAVVYEPSVRILDVLQHCRLQVIRQ